MFSHKKNQIKIQSKTFLTENVIFSDDRILQKKLTKIKSLWKHKTYVNTYIQLYTTSPLGAYTHIVPYHLISNSKRLGRRFLRWIKSSTKYMHFTYQVYKRQILIRQKCPAGHWSDKLWWLLGVIFFTFFFSKNMLIFLGISRSVWWSIWRSRSSCRGDTFSRAREDLDEDDAVLGQLLHPVVDGWSPSSRSFPAVRPRALASRAMHTWTECTLFFSAGTRRFVPGHWG